MERAFSVDDILGTFWKLDTQGEGNGAGSGPISASNSVESLKALEREKVMNRSASEWALQEFLRESSTAGGSGPLLRAKSRFMVNEDDDEEEENEEEEETGELPSPVGPLPPLRSAEEFSALSIAKTEELRAMNNAVDHVEVKGALNPLFSGLQDEVNPVPTSSPQEYEYFLKHKLELACAAVALTRVCPVLFIFSIKVPNY